MESQNGLQWNTGRKQMSVQCKDEPGHICDNELKGTAVNTEDWKKAMREVKALKELLTQYKKNNMLELPTSS